jgi:hypothetical protein
LFLSEEETNSPQRIVSSSSNSLAGGWGRILVLIGKSCASCSQRRFVLFLFVREPLKTQINQAPHHTAASWGSFWSNNHDLPDKILASARGEVDGSDNEERPITKSRPNYKETTTSEEESGGEVGSDDSESSSEQVHHYSELDMGERNGPFTEADFYFIARYIASKPDWATMKFKHRWEVFHEKVFSISATFD